MFDWDVTALLGYVHIAFQSMQAEIGISFAGARRRRLEAAALVQSKFGIGFQVRLVSTKFCPLALVQLSWLVETIRQLKLIGVWRISDVPWISTEVPPVMV